MAQVAEFSGQKLRSARLAAGLSREQLCVAVGRGYLSLTGYELGRFLPPIDVVARLAAVLDCDINTFMVTPVDDRPMAS